MYWYLPYHWLASTFYIPATRPTVRQPGTATLKGRKCEGWKREDDTHGTFWGLWYSYKLLCLLHFLQVTKAPTCSLGNLPKQLNRLMRMWLEYENAVSVNVIMMQVLGWYINESAFCCKVFFMLASTSLQTEIQLCGMWLALSLLSQ